MLHWVTHSNLNSKRLNSNATHIPSKRGERGVSVVEHRTLEGEGRVRNLPPTFSVLEQYTLLPESTGMTEKLLTGMFSLNTNKNPPHHRIISVLTVFYIIRHFKSMGYYVIPFIKKVVLVSVCPSVTASFSLSILSIFTDFLQTLYKS